jgi:putative tributyrin esterase
MATLPGARRARPVLDRPLRRPSASAHHLESMIVALLSVVLAVVAPHSRVPPVGTVRVDTLRSQALGTRKQFVVYLPPSYERDSTRRYPVAYYLHGLDGDQWNWVRHGRLNVIMDSLVAAGRPEMIVVMPDADDSWYTTWNTLPAYRECLQGKWKEPAESYCVPWPHYDDYIARDLVAYVDSTYRTIPDRTHRATGGLSMGGYGAISLALAYPDVWSAAASHSGVLSPLYIAQDSGYGARGYAGDPETLRRERASWWASIGPAFGRDTAGWWARDPSRLAARTLRARPGLMPALFFDVGRQDKLLAQNRELHRVLDSLGVRHAYAEWPGAHGWVYWRAHVGESLAWVAERIGGMGGDEPGAESAPSGPTVRHSGGLE